MSAYELLPCMICCAECEGRRLDLAREQGSRRLHSKSVSASLSSGRGGRAARWGAGRKAGGLRDDEGDRHAAHRNSVDAVQPADRGRDDHCRMAMDRAEGTFLMIMRRGMIASRLPRMVAALRMTDRETAGTMQSRIGQIRQAAATEARGCNLHIEGEDREPCHKSALRRPGRAKPCSLRSCLYAEAIQHAVISLTRRKPYQLRRLRKDVRAAPIDAGGAA